MTRYLFRCSLFATVRGPQAIFTLVRLTTIDTVTMIAYYFGVFACFDWWNYIENESNYQ